MRVLITGATGFVGRRCATALLQAGHDVRAPVRSLQAAPPEWPAGVALAMSNPLAPGALAQALDGVDAVVHLAARVHVMRETERDVLAAYRSVNVAGTETVLRASVAAGVRRFIYLSTVKVLGEGREEPYSDADSPAPADPYAQSKVEAEALVQASGMPTWAILRPPLIYGVGVGGNFRRLLQLAWIGRQWPIPLGGIDNRRSMVYRENLCDAIATCLTVPRIKGSYLVSDDEDLSTSDLLRRLIQLMDGTPRLVPVPVSLLRLLGGVTGHRAELDRLLGSFQCRPDRLTREVGWRPPCSVDAGLGECAAWWRRESQR